MVIWCLKKKLHGFRKEFGWNARIGMNTALKGVILAKKKVFLQRGNLILKSVWQICNLKDVFLMCGF